MNKTKIDWADMTWNPVTGCYHDCEYCYARKIANRFTDHYVSGDGDTYLLSDKAAHYVEKPELSEGRVLIVQKHPIFKNIGLLKPNGKAYSAYPFGFCPTFHSQRLNEPSHIKKPQNIFVCSMADLFGAWVPDKWIEAVFKACRMAPQHRYLFLTKNPAKTAQYDKEFRQHKNWWCGITAATQASELGLSEMTINANRFISIEPILEPVIPRSRVRIPFADWAIVGAETGNRKGKVIPEKAWIDNLVDQCQAYDVPVFMKESLRSLMGAGFKQEFPWGGVKA